MVSVIVPVYNVEKYLPKCIESILCQTYSELEIILVDDGSSDQSGEICDAYSLKDSRIKVIHKENSGSVSARNAGISIAEGEYIGFVDSDDWIEQDMYQTLYSVAVSKKADIVAEGVVEDYKGECFISLNQLSQGRYSSDVECREIQENMVSCMDFFCFGIQPYLWNKLFRRELVWRHMNKIPCSIRVGEDAAAIFPMFAMAGSIVVLDTAHYHYCHREDSIMFGDKNEWREYDNNILLHIFLKQTFRELGIFEIMEKQLFRYSINNLLARSYGRFAKIDIESLLFPFSDIRQDDLVVIYGAGAFGKAVYQYAISCTKLRVKAWVDQNALFYRNIGFCVNTLDEVEIGDTDKVIVTVFSEAAYRAIKEKLIGRGIRPEQVQWIDTDRLEKYFKESEVGYDA